MNARAATEAVITAKPQASRLLCVHQGFELYGSDRTFLSSLEALREKYPLAECTVVIPAKGPLFDVLVSRGFTVVVENIWVARKADSTLVKLKKLLLFPLHVLHARRNIQKFDLTYINTSVVFDYMIAARLSTKPVIIHVHEIPGGFAMSVIRNVLKFMKAAVVYNSQATKTAFALSTSQQEAVILNGVTVSNALADRPADARRSDGNLRILMIGRINTWKGQDTLIEAVAALPETDRRKILIRLAGASFQDQTQAADLKERVQQYGLTGQVEFLGFVNDPASHYQWADVIVVPSKKPEPFGLVAIEAMAHERAVIAANHGGLTEIVMDGQTGLLFQPNNPDELGVKLLSVLQQPQLLRKLGHGGRIRFHEQFTEDAYKRNFGDFVGKVMLETA